METYKPWSLLLLRRHMSEAEALRFLHDVVDVHQLERKLTQKFSGEKVVEEVRWVRFGC